MSQQLYTNAHNERIILTACLSNYPSHSFLTRDILPSDFYAPAHQIIMYIIFELRVERITPTIERIEAKLLDSKLQQKIGGLSYLKKLSPELLDDCDFKQEILLFKRGRHYHNIFQILNQKLEGIDDEIEQNIILEGCEQALINQRLFPVIKPFCDNEHLIGSVMEKIKRRKAGLPLNDGLDTGFRDLNKLLGGGLEKKKLMLLGGRPAMGTTSLASSMVHSCIKNDLGVVYFALDNSAQGVIYRLLQLETGIRASDLHNGNWKEADLQLLETAQQRLNEYPLYIDDSSYLEVKHVVEKLRKLKKEQSIDFVVIDKISHLRGRSQQIDGAYVSQRLQAIAEELDLAILVLSPLSRKLEKRPDKRPQFSDLIRYPINEAYFSIISFLYRDEYYHLDTDEAGIAEVIVVKNTEGGTGTVKLGFDGSEMRFFDC